MSVPHIYTEEDVDYWRDKAIKLETELDRLRDELTTYKEALREEAKGNAENCRDRDRLRAEIAELKHLLKVLIDPPREGSSGVVIEEACAILAKTIKEEQ